MALRCFLFSSDEETTERLRQTLLGIGVQAEFCSEAVVAVERITNQPFQLVIIDWDRQPEAGLLLTTARERKAAERPITLAIVNDDSGVPRALQAGANSVLRKPIVVAQAKETLATARDLLHAKQGSAASNGAAAAANSSAPSSVPASLHAAQEKHLRAGEFLQSARVTPGAQFETEPDASTSPEQLPAAEIDPLKELEPVAAPVGKNKVAEPQPAPSNEGSGLEWYLKNRVAGRSTGSTQAPGQRGNPDLMGYDQAPYSPPAEPEPVKPAPLPKLASPLVPKPTPEVPSWQEQEKEAELFSYIESGSDPSEAKPQAGFRLWKRAIVFALFLAACAVVAAPQAPWHSKIKGLWANERQALHAWLNPQPVTPPQAPTAHENFYRAGDEYKLPVAENIPDATTDPTQIRVVPVVDPTAKKANSDAGGADPSNGQSNAPAADQPQAPPGADNQPQSPTATPQAVAPAVTPVVAPVAAAPHADPFPLSKVPTSAPAQPKPSLANTVMTASNVPSSLKTQLASMAPEASGNKLPEAALPSIEPVNVPEAAERALLTDQPVIPYPANVKGDQGTVVLQVLIGRDGTVQDVKFLQGALAFARPAIDGVRQWKFKPYSMNGRPVSVQTVLTMQFKPGR